MKKKIVSSLLALTVAASMLAGCGAQASAPATDAAPAADTAAPAADAAAPAADAAAPAEVADAADEGKVLNIYCWNEEFKNRVTDHYAGYEAVDGTHGKIGDIDVVWNITPNDNNAYQDNLDSTLLNQENAAADDKVDLFLVEADYALKYVNADVTMPVADLGVTDADVANQYKYTKDVVTDAAGNLKGVSWQACPGALFYNRDIATEVFGTDDAAEVQAYVKDWATFNETAAKLKEAGYTITSTVNDAYRVYSNNVTSKWVEDGKLNIDANIAQWVEDSKALVDAGETTTAELWSDDWKKGFFPQGKVFCYFGPAWLINFCMAADEEGSVAYDGKWGITEGPQGFFWGGTWMCAAAGTDNAATIKDMMLKLTCDEEVMKGIVTKDDDFVNHKAAMEAMAQDETYKSKVLGGINPLAMYCNGAANIDLSNLSDYDQGCNEEFQGAMKNYFDGNATYDEALALFKTAISEKYPDVTVE